LRLRTDNHVRRSFPQLPRCSFLVHHQATQTIQPSAQGKPHPSRPTCPRRDGPHLPFCGPPLRRAMPGGLANNRGNAGWHQFQPARRSCHNCCVHCCTKQRIRQGNQRHQLGPLHIPPRLSCRALLRVSLAAFMQASSHRMVVIGLAYIDRHCVTLAGTTSFAQSSNGPSVRGSKNLLSRIQHLAGHASCTPLGARASLTMTRQPSVGPPLLER